MKTLNLGDWVVSDVSIGQSVKPGDVGLVVDRWTDCVNRPFWHVKFFCKAGPLVVAISNPSTLVKGPICS